MASLKQKNDPRTLLKHDYEKLSTSTITPPIGYEYVPKGNAFLTRHCRAKTASSGKTLYVVYDPTTIERLGLHCPVEVYNEVRDHAYVSADKQSNAADFKESREKERIVKALLALVPRIPATDADQIYGKSLMQHSGGVSRATDIDDVQKVKLAVIAHIRHHYTNYDDRLDLDKDVYGEGAKKRARTAVEPFVKDTARSWGFNGNIMDRSTSNVTRRRHKAEKRLEQIGNARTDIQNPITIKQDSITDVQSKTNLGTDNEKLAAAQSWIQIQKAWQRYQMQPYVLKNMTKRLQRALLEKEKKTIADIGLRQYRENQLALAIEEEWDAKAAQSAVQTPANQHPPQDVQLALEEHAAAVVDAARLVDEPLDGNQIVNASGSVAPLANLTTNKHRANSSNETATIFPPRGVETGENDPFSVGAGYVSLPAAESTAPRQGEKGRISGRKPDLRGPGPRARKREKKMRQKLKKQQAIINSRIPQIYRSAALLELNPPFTDVPQRGDALSALTGDTAAKSIRAETPQNKAVEKEDRAQAPTSGAVEVIDLT